MKSMLKDILMKKRQPREVAEVEGDAVDTKSPMTLEIDGEDNPGMEKDLAPGMPANPDPDSEAPMEAPQMMEGAEEPDKIAIIEALISSLSPEEVEALKAKTEGLSINDRAKKVALKMQE